MINPRFLTRTVALAALAMALGVASVVLWVALYSEVISPGLGEPFYRAYANRVAPIIGIVTGIPLLFVAGRFASRQAKDDWRAGAAVGIAYVLIDAPLLFALSDDAIPWGYVALSYVTKLSSAAAGGWAAARKPLANG